jgi:WhiB family redox-sensing transcriptional regulator
MSVGVGVNGHEPDWKYAACRNEIDPDIFYPEYGNAAAAYTAKRVCRNCLLHWQCLDWAVRNREEHGVWGGTSERERRRLWGGKDHPADIEEQALLKGA